MGIAKVLVHLGQLNTRLEDNEADVSGDAYERLCQINLSKLIESTGEYLQTRYQPPQRGHHKNNWLKPLKSCTVC